MNFAALAVNLGAHPLNFRPDIVKLHGVLVQPARFESDEAQR
jgi:hypothetical protein